MPSRKLTIIPEGFLPNRNAFTVGEVARSLNVSTGSVKKWCDNGSMKHFRIPQGRDRRVLYTDLVRFCEEHNVPVPKRIGSCDLPVIIMSRNKPMIIALQDSLVANGIDSIDIWDWFDIGKIVSDFSFGPVVVDRSMGVYETSRAVIAIRGINPLVHITAILTDDETPDKAKGLGINSIIDGWNIPQIVKAIMEHKV